MLQRANSIVNNYKRGIKEVEDRMMQRYKKLMPTKPVTPRLRTLMRADSRAKKPNPEVIAAYSGPPEFAYKHSSGFNRYSVRVRK